MRAILTSRASMAAMERGPDHPTMYVLAMWVHGLDKFMFHPMSFREEKAAKEFVRVLEKRDREAGREIVYDVRREG